MLGKSFEEVVDQIKKIEFSESFDLIVAIANGGIIPAALLNQRLKIDLQLLKINLRDEKQQALYPEPRLMEHINFEYKNKRILLVEDRVKTGASLKLAIKLLEGAETIKTFAVNGNADYSLYNETCFKFPWIL